jgi:hypothetical protein
MHDRSAILLGQAGNGERPTCESPFAVLKKETGNGLNHKELGVEKKETGLPTTAFLL